jgi:hypothetical protein
MRVCGATDWQDVGVVQQIIGIRACGAVDCGFCFFFSEEMAKKNVLVIEPGRHGPLAMYSGDHQRDQRPLHHGLLGSHLVERVASIDHGP